MSPQWSAGSSAVPLSQPHSISDVPPYLRPSVKLDGGRVILGGHAVMSCRQGCRRKEREQVRKEGSDA
jgi:hypothetical protein